MHWVAIACLGLALAGSARAEGVPAFMNYQGVLLNGQGIPITNKVVTKVELDPDEAFADIDRTNNVWNAAGAGVS